MSDENTARHAECTVEFDGVDITSSIKPYLLSLTFTDNEEDASETCRSNSKTGRVFG